MSFPSTDLAAANRVFRSAKNSDGTLDLVKGSFAQWDVADYDGIGIKEPVTGGLLADFAGILVSELLLGDQKNAALCVEGVVPCYFKNHASAVAGTWVTPVNSERYGTYSSIPTGILLLTDQSSGTSETSVDTVTPPKVWILPGFNKSNKSNFFSLNFPVVDVGTAETLYGVCPMGGRLVAAYSTLFAAISSADSVITISDGTNTAAVITVPNAASAAGTVTAGVLSATDANRLFTAGEQIKIVNGGESTGTARGTVTLLFAVD